MSTRTFLEVEAKFAVNGQATVPDLTRIDGVASIAVTTGHRLSAIYYDTEDLRLTRSKITLRRRSGGKDDGWHLKLPGATARLEVQAPLGEPVDGQFQVPEELREQVSSLVRNTTLVPIAQVDNERSESVLAAEDGSPVAEFCDDHVTAWSLLPGGDRTSWREWEVELSGETAGTGAGADLLKSATALLLGAGARMSASPSKLVAALGESLSAVPLPPFLVDAELDSDSPAFAVIEALKLNRDKLLEFDPKVRRDEWDSVHQMRVATRELRSHMETFDGILGGDEVKHIEEELKLLAQMLGAARDAEVVEERFLSLLDSEDSDVLDETTRGHLREDMGAEYRRAHRRVVATLNSERYLDLLEAIDRLLADPPIVGADGTRRARTPVDETMEEDGVPATPTEGPEIAAGEPVVADEETEAGTEPEEPAAVEDVEEILSRHLDEAYAKLMKRHRKAVKNWDNHELTLHEREEYFHDMRKSAKKLRYSAEAVGAATELKTKRLYKACKDMQSILGDFQDSVTSRDRLVKMAEQARRRGEDTFGYGLLYQRERSIGLDSLDDYSDAVKKITSAYERLSRKRK